MVIILHIVRSYQHPVPEEGYLSPSEASSRSNEGLAKNDESQVMVFAGKESTRTREVLLFRK